jgi:hypothetical protein
VNDAKRGFLIMPFDTALEDVRQAIIGAGRDTGVAMERADDIFKPGVVLDQILQAIDTADVVVGVCTGRNPNVFFELGYAWRMRDPLLVAKDESDLPFDIQHYRTALYGRETPGQDLASLQSRVASAIRAVLANPTLPRGRRLTSSPVSTVRARLTGSLVPHGRNYRFVIRNSGQVDVSDVDVEVPADATSLHLVKDGYLPIASLRPGEQVPVPAMKVMGGGPPVFDVVIRGRGPDGAVVASPVKITL